MPTAKVRMRRSQTRVEIEGPVLSMLPWWEKKFKKKCTLIIENYKKDASICFIHSSIHYKLLIIAYNMTQVFNEMVFLIIFQGESIIIHIVLCFDLNMYPLQLVGKQRKTSFQIPKRKQKI